MSESAAVHIVRENGLCRVTITNDPIFREFAFASRVIAALEPDDRILVIDLSRVDTLHSPGLANLVQIHVQFAKRGGSIRLAGLTALNRQLLATTRLDRLFDIEA